MATNLLSYADLQAKGLGSRVTIWRKLRDISLKFPQPIDIGYGQKRWKETEIDDWIKARSEVAA